MEKFTSSGEKNPDDARVSREELDALGITIPESASMTRGELNRRLEREKFKSAAERLESENAAELLGKEMSQLSDEEIKKAQEAGMRREETGK